MLREIVGLVEKVDLAVAESAGVLPAETLSSAAEARDRAHERLAFPESMLVAGLVGGTGSGKSSIFNAVAGEELSEVGGIRPTTAEPIALIPAGQGQVVEGLLDRLGIDRRESGSGLSWLCLVDLPDTDSLVLGHRHTVESMTPHLDVVIWVVDPEKYRDAAIHERIQRLSGQSERFLFVLNQVDRLSAAEVEQVRADLENGLMEDGIASPLVFLAAANPAAGPPVGVDGIVAHLEGLAAHGDSVYRRLVSDLLELSRDLSAAASGADTLEFEERWSEVLTAATGHIEAGRTADAIHVARDLIEALSEEAGDETAAGLRSISLEVAPIVNDSDGEPIDRLDRQIGGPVRTLLRQRARSHAAIAELYLSASETARKMDV